MASPTIRMLWGLAKSPELSMTDEELHLLVSAHTGKDSIKALNKRELGTMVSVLQNMKDSSSKGTRNRQRQTGNVGTENQRKKIYKADRGTWMGQEGKSQWTLQEDVQSVKCGVAQLSAVFQTD